MDTIYLIYRDTETEIERIRVCRVLITSCATQALARKVVEEMHAENPDSVHAPFVWPESGTPVQPYKPDPLQWEMEGNALLGWCDSVLYSIEPIQFISDKPNVVTSQPELPIFTSAPTTGVFLFGGGDAPESVKGLDDDKLWLGDVPDDWEGGDC